MQGLREKIRKGYSLIELAMVLMVIGFMAASSVVLSAQFEAAKITETKQKLDVIESKILEYLAKNVAIPCPSQPDLAVTHANAGVEACSVMLAPADPTGPYSHHIQISPTPTNWYTEGTTRPPLVLMGSVPVEALGLPKNYMVDSWNNKITYAMTYQLKFAFPQTNMGLIRLAHQMDPLSVTLVSNAAYVLISHGPNGSYAKNASGGDNAFISSSSSESFNNSVTAHSPVPTGRFAYPYFSTEGFISGTAIVNDDIVRYQRRDILVQEVNYLVSNKACQTAFTVLQGTPSSSCAGTSPSPSSDCATRLSTLATELSNKCLIK